MVEHRGIEGGDDEGRVPVEAQLLQTLVRRRLQAHAVARVQVNALQLAPLAGGVDDVRVGGIEGHPEAVATVDRLPVRIENAAPRILAGAPVGGAGAHPGAIVLQATAHPVGRREVHIHVIELTEIDVVEEVPAVGPVVAQIDAAVVAQQDVARVLGIDDDGVVIHVHFQRSAAPESDAAVVADGQVPARQVNPLFVLGIQGHPREVEGTEIELVDAHPVRAAVLATEEAAGG